MWRHLETANLITLTDPVQIVNQVREKLDTLMNTTERSAFHR